jgi:hypothetical protein
VVFFRCTTAPCVYYVVYLSHRIVRNCRVPPSLSLVAYSLSDPPPPETTLAPQPQNTPTRQHTHTQTHSLSLSRSLDFFLLLRSPIHTLHTDPGDSRHTGRPAVKERDCTASQCVWVSVQCVHVHVHVHERASVGGRFVRERVRCVHVLTRVLT